MPYGKLIASFCDKGSVPFCNGFDRIRSYGRRSRVCIKANRRFRTYFDFYISKTLAGSRLQTKELHSSSECTTGMMIEIQQIILWNFN